MWDLIPYSITDPYNQSFEFNLGDTDVVGIAVGDFKYANDGMYTTLTEEDLDFFKRNIISQAAKIGVSEASLIREYSHYSSGSKTSSNSESSREPRNDLEDFENSFKYVSSLYTSEKSYPKPAPPDEKHLFFILYTSDGMGGITVLEMPKILKCNHLTGMIHATKRDALQSILDSGKLRAAKNNPMRSIAVNGYPILDCDLSNKLKISHLHNNVLLCFTRDVYKANYYISAKTNICADIDIAHPKKNLRSFLEEVSDGRKHIYANTQHLIPFNFDQTDQGSKSLKSSSTTSSQADRRDEFLGELIFPEDIKLETLSTVVVSQDAIKDPGVCETLNLYKSRFGAKVYISGSDQRVKLTKRMFTKTATKSDRKKLKCTRPRAGRSGRGKSGSSVRGSNGAGAGAGAGAGRGRVSSGSVRGKSGSGRVSSVRGSRSSVRAGAGRGRVSSGSGRSGSGRGSRSGGQSK